MQVQIDALVQRADAAEARADQSEARAAASDRRADDLGVRTDALEARAGRIEAQAEIDRDMIAELQREGILSQEHASQMEEALRSSRTIGAAIGLIMGTRRVSETQAFEILKTASSNSNRKLRELAAELVSRAA